MFMASLFGTTQAYTSRHLAERALAFYVLKKGNVSKYNSIEEELFHQLISLCLYDAALRQWNEYAKNKWNNNPFYLAEITELKTDQFFR